MKSLQNQLMPSDAAGPRQSGRVDGHVSKHQSWEEGSNRRLTCGELTAATGSTCFFRFRVPIQPFVVAEQWLDVENGRTVVVPENTVFECLKCENMF